MTVASETGLPQTVVSHGTAGSFESLFDTALALAGMSARAGVLYYLADENPGEHGGLRWREAS